MTETTKIDSFEQSISKWRKPIMGLCMLAIMLFHQWFFKTNPFPFNMFHNYGYWGVDVFLFLSGMGLIRSLQRNSIPMFYKRRIIRIVPSCIVFGTTRFVAFLLLGAPVIIQQALNIGVLSIVSLDLWFIDTIIILYIITPILYKSLSRTPIATIICIIIIYLISQYIASVKSIDRRSLLGVLSWTIARLPVFSLGMYLSINKCGKKYLYISVFFLLLAIIIVIAQKINIIIPPLNVIHSLILALGMPSIIIISIKLLKSLSTIPLKFFTFLGEYSLELYLIHEFAFCVMNVELYSVNPCLLLISAFFISCFTAYVLRHFVKMITNCIVNMWHLLFFTL